MWHVWWYIWSRVVFIAHFVCIKYRIHCKLIPATFSTDFVFWLDERDESWELFPLMSTHVSWLPSL